MGDTWVGLRAERFANHQIHQSLSTLESKLSALPTPQGQEAADLIEDAAASVASLLSGVESADPAIAPVRPLDMIDQRAREGIASLDLFVSTNDGTHLINLRDSLDSAIEEMAYLPMATHPDIDRMRIAARKYRQSVVQLSRGAEAEIERTREALQRVQGRADEVDDAIVAAARDVGTKIEAQFAPTEAKVDSAVTTVEAQKARVDALIAGFQTQFSEAEAARAAQAVEAAGERQTAAAAALDTANIRFSTLASNQEAAAAEVLTRLEGQEQRARTLVDTVGAIGTSGGWGRYAAQQKGNADLLRNAAIGCLFAIIAIGVWYIWDHGNTPFDLGTAAPRLWLTIPLFAIAAYCVAQSGNHREAEQQARKLELDLAAIEPYLSLFDKADREKLKAELSHQLFGRPLAPKGKADTIGAQQLLDAIVKLLGDRLPKP
jgi:hypothetical protein